MMSFQEQKFKTS